MYIYLKISSFSDFKQIDEFNFNFVVGFSVMYKLELNTL
jgi:hypothetical protein